MAASISRPQLRELLLSTFRTDSDLSAFVLDRFPKVHESFSDGMTRTSKLNLLLEHEEEEDILAALVAAKPALAHKLHEPQPVAMPASTTSAATDAPTSTTSAESAAASHAAPDSAAPSKYVLHLSDLHFTESSQAPQWHTQLLLDLKNQMKIKELAAIILSGDITNHATEKQFGYAQQFLERVCKTFGVAKERLVVVPGNHDVSWELAKAAYEPKPVSGMQSPLPENMYRDPAEPGMVRVRLDSEYPKRFQPFQEFYRRVCGGEYSLDYPEQAKLHVFEDLDLVVLGLNSAWKTDHAYRNRAGLHAGAFGDSLSQVLDEDAYASCTKLAVWHHPPSELTLEGDLDGAALQQLAQAGFQLVLHGHVHRADNPSFRYYRQEGNVEILTAGTFGAPTHELVPGYPFQYQVLEFKGDLLTVHTRKREDVAGGWMPDHRWQQAPGQSPLASYQIQLRRRADPVPRHSPIRRAPAVVRPASPHPAGSDAKSSTVFGDGTPVHWCDREKQTKRVKELMSEQQHHVVLVPGPPGEAHELFLTRLDRVLSNEVPHVLRWLHWPVRQSEDLPPFPTVETELLSYLAQTLGGHDAKELPTLLANHLHDHDLLLLHPLVHRGFAEQALLLYYTEWLPKLLSGLKTRHHCKFIQPISWSKEQSAWTRLFSEPRSTRAQAYAYIHRIETEAPKNGLQVECLHELEQITKGDVIDFLRRCKYAEHLSPKERDQVRDKLADQIISGKATSEMILHKLAEALSTDPKRSH